MERQIAEIEQANKQGASRKTWEIINGICGKLVPCPVVEVKSSMAKSSNPQKSFLMSGESTSQIY